VYICVGKMENGTCYNFQFTMFNFDFHLQYYQKKYPFYTKQTDTIGFSNMEMHAPTRCNYNAMFPGTNTAP
jgi:hypothetical protein